MREILIYRHGHAHVDGYSTDIERELRDKGKRNAQRIGIWLARNNLLPDRVISSPAVRARRTAEKTIKTAGMHAGQIIIDPAIYQAELDDLLYLVKSLPDEINRVMLVGHNPSLEDLLKYLCWNPLPKNKKGHLLSPAALAWLQLDVDWKEVEAKTAELKTTVFPKTLPRLFPFPGIDNKESRSRPAYYYRQSAVVPFRINNGAIEVLIITSSKNRHWVIPKGIHDPGLSARESAAKEAFEEAGASGEVLPELLGEYSYPKWDAHCDVEVYPMRVDKITSQEQWQESHRQRRWVSVEEGMKEVENQDVSRMISLLPEYLETYPNKYPNKYREQDF